MSNSVSQEQKQIFAENLKKLLEENGKTQSDLVNHFGITASTISDWCNAKKYPRVDKVQKLADYFGVLKSDLTEKATDLEPYNPTKRIPILGYISAGLPLYAEEHVEGHTYTDLNGGSEYFALRVKGDSMTAARIFEGDLVIIRKQDIVDNGEIAVVMVNDDEATVKIFNRTGSIVTLTPQSYNPEHKIQVYDLRHTNIRILGKVIRVQYDL